MKSRGYLKSPAEPRRQCEGCSADSYRYLTDPVVRMSCGEDKCLQDDRDHRDPEPGSERLHDKTSEHILLGYALQRTEYGKKDEAQNSEFDSKILISLLYDDIVNDYRQAVDNERYRHASPEHPAAPSAS